MKKINRGWLLLAITLVILPVAAHAQVSTGAKVAAFDVPSVYQIFAVANATIAFPQFTVDGAMNVTPRYKGLSPAVLDIIADLNDKINNNGEDLPTAQAEEVAQGVNSADLMTAVAAFNDPQNYASSSTFSESTIIQSGSAFVIDEGGYIVTNAHVVTLDDGDIQQTLVDDYTNGSSTDDLFSSLGIDPASDNGQAIMNNLSAYLSQYAVVESSTPSYIVLPPSVDRTASYNDVINDGWDAKLIYTGDPYPGKDLALLKLSLNYKIPALDLSSVDPNVGDSTFVIGFPGAANLTQDVENQATFTAGSVSAVRKSDTGDFSVFQTDASSGAGSSGGPVLNSAGDVVGVLTLGSGASDGGGNFNYFLPVSLIREMLATANVQLDQSRTVTNAYRQGVALLQSGSCSTGNTDISSLQNSLDSNFINQLFSNCVQHASGVHLGGWETMLVILIMVIIVLLSIWYHRRVAIKK